MKLLFASDSFKGSLTSQRTAELLERAATEVFGSVECISLPVADGGEGTLDALLHVTHGTKVYVDAHDPLMRPIRVPFADLGGNRAAIEMAQVSGLTLVPVGQGWRLGAEIPISASCESGGFSCFIISCIVQ